MRPDYLFIRILEACNADCFMCTYARSHDGFRLSNNELLNIVYRARAEGVRHVRLTGGEPLVHRDIVMFVQTISSLGLRSSIITNGLLLPKKIDKLAAAGLDQVIVSVDDSDAEYHDKIRGIPGLFDRCIEGLRRASHLGLRTRVNTVVGPHNYRRIPKLQSLLTDERVEQWELSSLKLERPLEWQIEERREIEEKIIPYVYINAAEEGRLMPSGKIWCGDTQEERDRYFETGVTPRADEVCRVVHAVRYLDARNAKLFCCSLLPHRPEAWRYAARAASGSEFTLMAPDLLDQANFFGKNGPSSCTGCSTTAAGFSALLDSSDPLPLWRF